MTLPWTSREIHPYIAYSAGLHAGIVIALLWLARNHSLPAVETYRIDFIGPTATILGRSPGSASGETRAPAPAAAATRPPPLVDPQSMGRRSRRPLLRPSILSMPWIKKAPSPAKEQAVPPAEAPAAAPPAAQAGDGAGGEASVDTDLPNFPYPWYLTQLRGALWGRWSGRMPSAAGEALAVFTILRNGTVADLRVESSSGDDVLDYAALSAIQDCAPFPPLPRGFREPFLKVHVRFKSR